jgi:O-antigen ligase
MIYALATRLLPGIITSTPSLLTAGRLEQPLTYYNAQGALAGIGLVLCVHLIGDRVRASRLRAVAAAAVIPMSAAVWLSYSRGALAATAAGLLALLVLAPTWSQVRALALGLVAGTGAVIASLPFPTVSTIKVTGAAERSGAIYLGLLLALAAGAAALTLWAVRREQRAGTRVGRLPLSRAFTLGATASLIVGSALILYVLSTEKTASVKHGHVTTAARLASIDSNRSYYWPVAIRALERHPLNGLGAGGYHTAWLRERPIRDPARWAHSLELQTAADLGLVGLGALGLLLFGCGFAARRAHRHRPDLAAGWCAAGVVWLLHSALDWDWEVPTVTLVALILAGALIGLADERTGPHSQTRDMGRPEHARNDGPAPALTEAASGHAGAQAPLTRAGRAA